MSRGYAFRFKNLRCIPSDGGFAVPEPPHNLYRFPPFVFRKDTGSLERNGYAIRLSDQAAKVLGQFVERPGELIQRNQLSGLLWPDGVFTESELGINKIVSKLRIALRDDPRKPKYIETIPKRGYRFLAPVTLDHVSTIPLAPAAPEPTPPQVEADPLPPAPARRIPRRRVLWTLAATILLAIALAAAWHLRPKPPSSGTTQAQFSLAVAPFDVQDTDRVNEQLAESFRLDLIDSLSQMPGIGVTAAHSVAARGSAAPRKLDVTAILYTRFTRIGETYTLQMELVRNADSAHLHTWQYSGTVAQLASIREEAQADIFSYCTGSGKSGGVVVGSTRDPVAYELYLRARYHARQLDQTSLRRARAELREAIQHDPSFAKAYSGLARVTFQLAATDAEYREAESLAEHAMTLSPDIAEAHAVLGYSYFRHDWRFADGEREERRAIAIEPHESIYHVWLCFMLAKLGRFQESSGEIDLARRDDPYWVEVWLAEVYLDLARRQFDRAMQPVDAMVKNKPDWPDAYHERAWVNWLSGRYPQAIADWHRVAQMNGATERVAFEDRGLHAFNQGGEHAYARLRMQAALDYARQGHADSDFVPAEWAAYAGDYELTLRELTQVVDRRDREATNLAVNPAYRPLHRDPRFQALLRRVGLPEPNDAPQP
jgi:DNA-binding winged helix-turn-helix (wHTH) protein/tetratricopeptide (TPR) repeat protein